MTSSPCTDPDAVVAREALRPRKGRGGRGSELRWYLGNIAAFTRTDWLVYVGWVGMMVGLVGATGGFLVMGHLRGVTFPASAWCVPAGAAVFAAAIAIDTIGHRTVYKEALRGAEGLVHGITILCGVASCVLLCAAYQHRGLWIPAIVFTVLSFVYSLVDEVFHWQRYATRASDRVEMWSHVFIFVGHGTMMTGWWAWYFDGYAGVAATLGG